MENRDQVLFTVICKNISTFDEKRKKTGILEKIDGYSRAHFFLKKDKKNEEHPSLLSKYFTTSPIFDLFNQKR